MKTAYTAANLLEAHIVLNLLRQLGINGYISGEYLHGAIGELPTMDLLQIMVDESDYAAARSIIETQADLNTFTETALPNPRHGAILWLTGLPCSGKSTLAAAIKSSLLLEGHQVLSIDGDQIRTGLCADLGFSSHDRTENARRVAEVARLAMQSGMIAIVSLISPMRADRSLARNRAKPERFVEIYCCCPLSICEQRDVKGLYKRARAGSIADFTGISAPYEEPMQPEINLATSTLSVEQCVARVLDYLQQHELI